jgi:alpha-galactosidase
MVNEDSDLYRAHPDWAITTPGRKAAKGRHQLVLDLTRAEVRDYIVEQVGGVIDSTKASYVKWDFNRPLSDGFRVGLATQGEFFHRYVLGLYEVLERIFWARPHVLLESCASGGNRFDLGMLCFSPQIWASDDTDPIERLAIQGGLTHLYPPSTIGAHVSEAPHQQTLRNSPLTTRFNVAAFGCLGYELDLRMLSRVERLEIREQIAFYKAHRETFQFGRHYRTDRDTGAKPNKVVWTMVARDGSEAVTGLFQTLTGASEGFDRLPVDGLDPATRYQIETRPQSIFIGRFGGLVKHLLPVTLNPEGLILGIAKRLYRMTDAVETHDVYGALLADGLPLNNQFMGSYYNPQTRLLGDFGSNLYLTTRSATRTKPKR